MRTCGELPTSLNGWLKDYWLLQCQQHHALRPGMTGSLPLPSSLCSQRNTEGAPLMAGLQGRAQTGTLNSGSTPATDSPTCVSACMVSEAILHQNVHFNPHSTTTHEVLKQVHRGMHCSALPIHSVVSYPVSISIPTMVQRGNRDWVRGYTQRGSFVLTEYLKELHIRHLILYMQPHNALKG